MMTFLSASSNADWLIVGLLKFLPIMAVLQLVKKIPDIINGVFGTNIKTRGGIKGRLGEMAGIGGLAQKAWTALGNTGKNLAKLGLTAPAAGLYLGADALYHKKTGDRLKNNEAFRRGKGILYGARKALKTGSLMDAYQEFENASAPIGLKKADVSSIASKARTPLLSAGIDKHGNYNNHVNADGTGAFKTNANHDADAAVVISNAKSIMRSTNGQKLVTSMAQGFEAKKQANLAEGIQGGRDKVSTRLHGILDSMRTTGNYENDSQLARVEDIVTNFDKNGIVTADSADFIKRFTSHDNAQTLAEEVAKYDKNITDYHSRYGFKENADGTRDEIISETSLRGKVSLGDLVKENQKTVKDYDDTQKELLEDKNTSEADKVRYQVYSDALNEISGKYWGAAQNNKSADAPMSADMDWSREAEAYAATGTASDVSTSQHTGSPRTAEETSTNESIILGSDGNPIIRQTAPQPAPEHQSADAVSNDDIEAERQIVNRVEELRQLRTSNGLNDEQREEMNDLISDLRRRQANRHRNNE